MANDVSLRAFPKDQHEALTMLFMQNQDLSEKTPEEIAAIYDDAYQKIKDTLTTIQNERKERKEKEKPYRSILG